MFFCEEETYAELLCPTKFGTLKGYRSGSALSIGTYVMPVKDAFLILLDLIDLTDNFTAICKKVKVVYAKKTGKPFFYMVDEYNLRRMKISIALAMYDDLFNR